MWADTLRLTRPGRLPEEVLSLLLAVENMGCSCHVRKDTPNPFIYLTQVCHIDIAQMQ